MRNTPDGWDGKPSRPFFFLSVSERYGCPFFGPEDAFRALAVSQCILTLERPPEGTPAPVPSVADKREEP